MVTEKTKEIFENYHRFDDGLILSFEYFYAPGQPLAVQITMHAKSHKLPGSVWRNVEITIKGVKEVFVKIAGNQFNAISSGVKLLQFGNLWCVDVDGNYSMGDDPSTLDEVRENGECYVVGTEVEACEIEE